ncbi:hypothetical protein R6Z07M_002845 [Ovis aries]
MKLSSSHTSSGAPGGCQTSPVITLTVAPMTHLPSCESAPSTTHCSVQRPAEQARPTAARGSQALPVPAALTAATTQADLSRDPKRSNPGPGSCGRSLYSLLRHRRRRSGMHLATGSRPPPACPRQLLWQRLPVFEASGRERLRRSCYLRNLSLFAALPRSLQLSRSALRPAPPPADSTPRPSPRRRRPPTAAAGARYPEARRAEPLHPPGNARPAAWPWSRPSSGLARFPKLAPGDPPFPFRTHHRGTKTESTGGVVQPA